MLSGNPAAAMTAFYALLQPCIRKLSGLLEFANAPVRLTLAGDYRKESPRTRLLIGVADFSSGIVTFSPQERGKGSISSFDGVNAFAVIPQSSLPPTAGTILDGYLI
jgi:molybdopterin biosynthesis enzyme